MKELIAFSKFLEDTGEEGFRCLLYIKMGKQPKPSKYIDVAKELGIINQHNLFTSRYELLYNAFLQQSSAYFFGKKMLEESFNYTLFAEANSNLDKLLKALNSKSPIKYEVFLKNNLSSILDWSDTRYSLDVAILMAKGLKLITTDESTGSLRLTPPSKLYLSHPSM